MFCEKESCSITLDTGVNSLHLFLVPKTQQCCHVCPALFEPPDVQKRIYKTIYKYKRYHRGTVWVIFSPNIWDKEVHHQVKHHWCVAEEENEDDRCHLENSSQSHLIVLIGRNVQLFFMVQVLFEVSVNSSIRRHHHQNADTVQNTQPSVYTLK